MAEENKYLDLSGLQAFYDALKNKTSADSAFSLESDHPIQNKIISQYIAMQGENFGALSGAAASGEAASAWIESITGGGEGIVVQGLTATTISGKNVTADNLTSTSATLTHVSSTDISAGNTYVTSISSTNISALTAEGNSAKYENVSSTNITSENVTATAISSTSITATDISATTITGNLSGKAASADKLATPRNISITGGEIDWTVSFDGSKDTASSGHIKKVYWDALNGNTAGSGSTSTTGIMTPDQIQAAIDDKVAQAIGGVYQIQGNAEWSALTAAGSTAQHNGYVYNVIGTVPTSAVDHTGNRIIAGDNVVWVSAYTGTNKWDVLANTTEMTGKLDTTAFNTWSSQTFTDFTAKSATYAINVGTGETAQAASNVITSAAAGSAAYDWVTAHAKQTITGVTTATGKNTSLGLTETTSTSGTSITLNASGYKTTFNTDNWVTGSTANTYDITYGLSDSAITYMQEGHAASAAVSSLINGDTISAEKIIANDGFSGTNISGVNSNSTIDNLIGSAQSGQSAFNWIVANSGNMGLTPYTSAEIVNGIKW